MKKLLILAASALAIAGCHKTDTVTNGQGVNNITIYDGNSLPPDANITDVPADDGDAPGDLETNAK